MRDGGSLIRSLGRPLISTTMMMLSSSELTSMRPEQDGCDHDYPGQVGALVSVAVMERESLTISTERRNQTQDSLELIRV